MKKGIVHLIPLIAIAISLGTLGIGIATKQGGPKSTPDVLSSSDNKSNSGKGSSDESESSQKNNSVAGQNSNSGRGNDNKPSSSEKKPENDKEKVEIKIGPKKTEVKIRDGEIKFDLKTDETNQIVTFEATGGATPSAGLGKKVRTNFPITINPLTNEKIVTTPSGVHIVVLPEVAIRNMIKAGFPVISSPPEGSGSATPGEGSGSATPEGSLEDEFEETDIELAEIDGQPVYIVDATKDEAVLGIVPVKIKVKGILSAETGNLLELRRTLFSRILDLFSF